MVKMQRPVKKAMLAGTIGIFGVVGLLLITLSKADTYGTSSEAESGTVQGLASTQSNQSGASGGQSVLFGVSSTGSADRFGFAVGGDLQYMSVQEQNDRLAAIKDLGGTWVRFDLRWSEIQNAGADSYDWSRHDDFIARIQSYGLKPLPILLSVPSWNRPETCNTTDVCMPSDFTSFGNFAGQAAAHYASNGIHTWEIWNEPNNVVFWKPKPDAAAYTTMLKTAYTAIKAKDASAVVLGGSTSPADDDGTNISPRTFMKTMYAQGAKNYFDAFAHHPYCYAADFDCPKAYADWSAWSQMNDTSPSLRSIMADNGDTAKKIWLTEFGAPTGGDSTAVSEARQAQMVTDAYGAAKNSPWMGPLLWYSLKDRGTSNDREDWFGLIAADGRQKPAYTVYKNLQK